MLPLADAMFIIGVHGLSENRAAELSTSRLLSQPGPTFALQASECRFPLLVSALLISSGQRCRSAISFHQS